MSRTVKDMDRWLGDGGMPIIEQCGGAFTGYGVDGEDLGWATGTFTPSDLAWTIPCGLQARSVGVNDPTTQPRSSPSTP